MRRAVRAAPSACPQGYCAGSSAASGPGLRILVGLLAAAAPLCAAATVAVAAPAHVTPPIVASIAAPAQVDPPDVTGLTPASAAEELASTNAQQEGGYTFIGVTTDPASIPETANAVVVAVQPDCKQVVRLNTEACSFVLTVQAVVPDVRGQALRDARTTLETAGLALATSDPNAADERVVVGQQPEPEARLPFGGAVQVSLQAVDLPPLPQLAGRPLDEALAALTELATQRQAVSPNYQQQVRHEPVELPVPEARAWVIEQPADCAQPSRVCVITLDLGARVPGVRGMSLTRAEQALDDAGLGIAASGDTAAGSTVADQSPREGRVVGFDTPVEVRMVAAAVPSVTPEPTPTAAVTPTSAAASPPWWLLVVAVVAVVAVTGAAVRTLIRRRGPRWVARHVQVEPVRGSVSQTVEQPAGSGRSHAVRITPSPGSVQEWVEEVRP